MILRPITRTVRAGFTLIELLAVMLILGILATFLIPNIISALSTSEVTACNQNLKNIGQGLLSYRTQYKRNPSDSGVGFFACLIYDKVWQDTETNAKRMSCPAIASNSLTPHFEGLPMEEWYTDRERIDGGYSAYAGRDMKEHPIRHMTLDGKIVLIADDNDPDANHDTATNVLMGDNSVRTYEFMDLVRDGSVIEDEGFLRVGPDSQLEELHVLTLD